MLHHFSFSQLGNAYAAPSCILAALWSRRRCAGEAQPTHILILSSTHLYRSLLHRWGCSAGQGRRDWIEAVVLRCVPWRVHLRTQVVQWTLQREEMFLCSCECCPAEDLCVIAIFGQGSMDEVLRMCGKDWNTSRASVGGEIQKRILRLHVTNGMAWQWNFKNDAQGVPKNALIEQNHNQN